MSKKETIKEQLAVLRTENKYQTKAIDDLTDLMKDHVKSSEVFRKQCEKNTNDIKWIKRITTFVFTGGGLLTLGWNYLSSKFGG